jgi:Tfp pilus assembly protein FimT
MKPKTNHSCAEGFATVDIMIVAVIILIVVTYAWTAVTQAQRWQAREGAAQQFANFLERARSDSMRRRATDTRQMAEVTILNEMFYSVRTDENGDGVIDVPRVINLKDQQIKIDGPYPRTFMFDHSGKNVDNGGNPLNATYVTFGNRSGKSVVKISETGNTTWGESAGK